MPTAISDGEDDRRTPLPESVERVLGTAVASSKDGAVLDREALRVVLEQLQRAGEDSNFDRLPAGSGVDVLFDGTRAVRAIVEALGRRLEQPVRNGETLRLVPTGQ